jgi:C4-dicarboxylate-specific signal transduction histidine kinase
MEWLRHLLADPAQFQPHGFCLLWDPALVWTHLISDSLIALSYFSIPVALVYFVQKRRDVAFSWMFVMFGVFILLCGTTHVFGAWTLWNATYGIEGLVKAFTAIASVATASLMWPLLPRAIALPSPAQLRATNARLETEIAERTRAEHEVREMNVLLEQRVAERTAELANVNLRLEQRVRERTAALESANRALAASEARHSGIVSHSADAIFQLAVEPDGTCRFEAANAATCRDIGRPLEAMLGHTVAEALEEELAALLAEHCRDCIETQAPVRFEAALADQPSMVVWQTVLAPVLDPANGTVVQLIANARNVAETRLLQEELAQAAKLATLGSMAAGIAHEMSQPLNAIRITATDCALVLDEAQPDLDYVRQGMAMIRDQSARMGGVVDQMRQLGRRDAADVQLFDAGEPVRRAVDLLQRHFASADIEIAVAMDQARSPVLGHPARLEQVIINLLANGRDAIEAARVAGTDHTAGRIHVEVRTEPGRHIRIAVEDDGVGLTSDVASRIFDPFFTTKQASNGMGLGLSISAGIIQAMGGHMEAEPRKGGGARLIVHLPTRSGGEVHRPHDRVAHVG